ncbi:MAG TPA: hypothetical protein VMI94_20430 [Bryobacteraceae bacterium]|nr:hypothetical protein [Bryobacteraceae bacterium]
MRRIPGFLVALAVAAAAPAQVTLSTVVNGVTTPVAAGGVVPFGAVAAGWATADVAFNISYTGTATTYYLTYFSLQQDTPFSVLKSDWKTLPAVIPPGGLNFTVRFQPNQIADFSATLAVGDASSVVYLLGNATAGFTVVAANQTVPAGSPVAFGDVQVGASQSVLVTLANQTGNSLTVGPLTIEGSAFQISGSSPAGATVPAGSSANLQLVFTPTVAGPQQGTLTVGVYPIPLTGTGLAPPPPAYPKPSIQVTLATAASAQQGSISVSLASASAASGAGTVTLAFQSAVAGVSDDPMIAFTDGARSAAFTVAAGSAQGQFANGPSISFDTGTTAGTLTFTVTLGNSTAQASVTIPAASIGIDAAVAARDVACDPSEVYCTAVNVELQINGWDNTRSASQIVFTFFNSAGSVIAPGNITVAATAPFAQYFAGSDLGGVFGLHALFPVTGDSDQVVAAQVQITNSAGTAQTARITF